MCGLNSSAALRDPPTDQLAFAKAVQRGLMRRWKVVVLTLLVVMAASCSPEERAVELGEPPITAGVLGEPIELDDGLILTVSAISLNSNYMREPWQPTHVVQIQIENPTEHDLASPNFEMYCSNYASSGGWYLDALFDAAGLVLAHTIVEGSIGLSLPEVDGLAVRDCEEPLLRVETPYYFGGATVIDYEAR